MVEKQFFESIIRHVDKNNTEFIVIDDASPRKNDLEKLLLRVSQKGKLDMRIIYNKTNHGYPYNVNQGVDVASNNYVALATSDIFIPQGAIASMCSVLDQYPDVAVVGPTVNRTINRGYRAQAITTFNITAFSDEEYAKIENIAQRQREKPRVILDVNWVVGYFMIVRRNPFIEIGGADLRYGVGYGEETDFEVRLRRAGYRLAIDRNAFIFHGHPEKMQSYLGASMNTIPKEAAKAAVKNNLYFMKKNKLQTFLMFYDWTFRKKFKTIDGGYVKGGLE